MEFFCFLGGDVMKNKLGLTAAILLTLSASGVSQAGFNNAFLPSWGGLDGSRIPGNWNFVVAEPATADTITGTANVILGRNVGGDVSG